MAFSFKIEGVSDLVIARGGHVVARFVLSIVLIHLIVLPRGGGGGTPYNCLHGEAPPKGIPLSPLKYGQTLQI